MVKATKKASKSTAPKAKAKTHTIDGTTVTRHHPEGDSVQIFDSKAAAKDYAASIPSK